MESQGVRGGDNPQVVRRGGSQRRLLKLQKIGFQLQAQKLRREYSNKQKLGEMKLESKSLKKLPSELPQGKVGHFLEPTKIISVTAHKWVLFDYYSAKYLRGYRARDSHPLGVFSKLLVFCAVNTLVEKHQLDLARFEAIVTPGVLKMHGRPSEGPSRHQHSEQSSSSSLPCLRADDILSLQDLLHLMIMQEDELYQTVVAVNVGAYLQKKRQKEYYSVFDAQDCHMKQHLRQFYDLVNSYCRLLKLDNIRYVEADPQARREKNKGSASDVATLSIECLKVPFFALILRKLHHSATIKFIDAEGKLAQRDHTVANRAVLNKFIPYFSVCRNWDQAAFMDSHCAVFYQNPAAGVRPIVVVLLSCYGPADREKDIQQVAEWYIKQQPPAQGIGSESPPRKDPPQVSKKPSSTRLPSLQSDLQEQLERKLGAGTKVPFGSGQKAKRLRTQH